MRKKSAVERKAWTKYFDLKREKEALLDAKDEQIGRLKDLLAEAVMRHPIAPLRYCGVDVWRKEKDKVEPKMYGGRYSFSMEEAEQRMLDKLIKEINMFKVIEDAPEAESICIDALNIKPSDIVVAEWRRDRSVQLLLTQREVQTTTHSMGRMRVVRTPKFKWTNFYMRNGVPKESFSSEHDAVKWALDKDHDVFVLSNKTELKEFIKTRRS